MLGFSAKVVVHPEEEQLLIRSLPLRAYWEMALLACFRHSPGGLATFACR